MEKIFIKEHEKDQSYSIQYQEILEQYEELRFDAGCITCEVEKEDCKKLFFKRHTNCSRKEICFQIRELHKELLLISERQHDFEDNIYARKIFDFYSKKKPILIEKSSGRKVKWEDVFGNEFEKIPRNLKGSLTGLVENFDGKYKLG